MKRILGTLLIVLIICIGVSVGHTKDSNISNSVKPKQPEECEHEWVVVDDFMDSYCYCKKCKTRKY